MVKGKARAAGSFLGGLANNPAFIITAIVLGGLFIFRDRISSAIGGLGAAAVEGIGDINIQLPEIKLPEIKFPEFNFPEFKFPEFKFPDFNIFGGGDIPQPQKMVENTGLDPLATCECGASVVQDAFGNVNVTCHECAPAAVRNPALDREPSDAELFASQDPNLTPAQQFVQDEQKFGVSSFLIDEPTQKFEGGGLSFIGGSIFETPITAQSTLSFIIDKLGVSASKAASIRAELRGFTQEEALFLAPKVITPFGTVFDAAGGSGGGVNVSDSQFGGLTPQQIALILTGGNISNF